MYMCIFKNAFKENMIIKLHFISFNLISPFFFIDPLYISHYIYFFLTNLNPSPFKLNNTQTYTLKFFPTNTTIECLAIHSHEEACH